MGASPGYHHLGTYPTLDPCPRCSPCGGRTSSLGACPPTLGERGGEGEREGAIGTRRSTLGTYLTTVGASPGYLLVWVLVPGTTTWVPTLPRTFAPGTSPVGAALLRCVSAPPPWMREGARERERVPLVPAAPLWAPIRNTRLSSF